MVIVRGEWLYLVPNRPGCPGVAYKQPKVTIVSTAGRPMIGVRLPDDLGGAVMEVHEDNLAQTLTNPRPRPHRPQATGPTAEQPLLW